MPKPGCNSNYPKSLNHAFNFTNVLVLCQVLCLPREPALRLSWLNTTSLELWFRYLSRGVSSSGGVCIGGGGFASRAVLGRPPRHTRGYGQRVGGTHPIEMHSCLKCGNLWQVPYIGSYLIATSPDLIWY